MVRAVASPGEARSDGVDEPALPEPGRRTRRRAQHDQARLDRPCSAPTSVSGIAS
jgi:hypothetical protein